MNFTTDRRCRRCAAGIAWAQTLTGWQWVAFGVSLPDQRRYRCTAGGPLHMP
ncbi:hypothetical protein ACWEU6_22040 [Streptosporangium sandarakinum]